MKVLLVNNQYRPVAGGAESVLLNTQSLLEQAGHRTVPFAIAQPDTFTTEWNAYFPDGGRLARSRARSRDSLATVYSPGVRRSLGALIEAAQPDVAHLHNVYEKLTLSVVDALVKRRIPVVLTLHDYRAVCPNGRLMVDGRPCNSCVASGNYWNAIRRRCLHGSLWKTLIAAAECYVNKWRDQYRKIDLFIAPTRFLRDVMVAGGLPEERVRLVPNPVACDVLPARVLPAAPRFLFAGRLVAEKGLDVLLDAAARLDAGARVVVYGSGRYEEHVRRRIRAERLPVELHGYVARDVVARALRRTTAGVVPSLWYENGPLAIPEAAARGVPVIASDLGAMRQLVEHRRDGLLVAPGNAAALAAAMNELGRDRRLALRLGMAAWARARSENSPDSYLASLLAIYAEAADG